MEYVIGLDKQKKSRTFAIRFSESEARESKSEEFEG